MVSSYRNSNILLSNVETKTKVNNWLFGNKKQWLLQKPVLFEYEKLSFSQHEKNMVIRA